jgi:ferredoxin
MAEKNLRLNVNANGAFYVDSTCIDCDLCRSTAPEVFKREEEMGVSVVFHQPSTPQEYELTEEARVGCPTESIGKDGE